ncbi:hypothetical protein [Polyangium sp. y55x31]|uniref:hypothetical protein n=1 Tax=Polyangium sp. y55x31 TaxID=3042688 RepID=UPI0024831EC6|nr:hypothetical protein [Polyangium sp. y55x31]MDI1476634.1 hypothetical protein [Polyangium sp. y55x31]
MTTNALRTRRSSFSLPRVFLGIWGTAAIVAIAGCDDGTGTWAASGTSSEGPSGGAGGSMPTGGIGGTGGVGGQNCVPETCNSVDDDCDGDIDEEGTDVGDGCSPGYLGVCAEGATTCHHGVIICQSLVLPSPEIADGLDNDCNGLVDDGLALGNGLWAKGYGSDAASQSGFRIATDSAGNIGVIGTMTGGNIHFGGDTMTVTGSADAFLVKLDPNGGFLWQQQFSATNELGHVNALAFDPAGHVFTAGYFVSGMTVGGASLTPIGGGGDIFLLKHDGATGVVLWSKVLGESTNSQNAVDIAATKAGGVVVTGTVNGGAVDFGGGGLNGSHADAFLAMYDATGAHVFSKRFVDSAFQYGRGVAVNAAGEIVLAAEVQNTIDFGGGVLVSTGLTDVALAKFAADGTHIWSNVYGSSYAQEVSRVAFDPQGNILVAGTHQNALEFGCGPVFPPNDAGFFVAKFDPNGACLWTKTYGTTPAKAFYAPTLAVDPAGNVIVAGTFLGSMDLGGGVMNAVASSPDIFVLKLSPAGDYLWSKHYGDPLVYETDVCNGVATDPMGNIVLTGEYGGTIDFGLGTLSSGDLNTQDVFVAKLSP